MKKTLWIVMVLGVLSSNCLAGINDELWDSVQKDSVDKINGLISRGADVNTKDKNGATLLMVAAMNSQSKFWKERLKFLLSKGANVNIKDNEGNTVLMYGSDLQTTELLILNGADINTKNSNGMTPLMMVARGAGSYDGPSNLLETTIKEEQIEKYKIAKFLILKGADVNAISNNGLSALSIAESSGQKDIVKLLKGAGSK